MIICNFLNPEDTLIRTKLPELINSAESQGIISTRKDQYGFCTRGMKNSERKLRTQFYL